MELLDKTAICLVLLTIFTRFLPAILICILSDRGFLNMGHYDPIIYLSGAQAIVRTGENPFNYFPPLNFLFIAGLLYFGKGNPIFATFGMTVVGSITVLVIYLLCEQLYDKKTALIAAIICGLYPNLIFHGTTFHSETLAIFWIVLAFLMIIRFLSSHKHIYLFLGALTWGLACQTRGGLHLFSIMIALLIIIRVRTVKWFSRLGMLATFFITVYGTIYLVGIIVSPIQKGAWLNSGSGIGSAIHGLNRITTSCSDYGDIRGNIFYDINYCGEAWPPGSQLYSIQLLQDKLWPLAKKAFNFIREEQYIFAKGALRKLSCFWSPNQNIIYFMKMRFYDRYQMITQATILMIILSYIFLICLGIIGVCFARDQFRPIFLMLILYYFILIPLTVGNSKLRLPLIPFFAIYCAFSISHLRLAWLAQISFKKVISYRWGICVIVIMLFLSNCVCKYGEISLSPGEIIVQKIELCQRLGFPKTAKHLIEENSQYHFFSNSQKERIDVAIKKIQ